MSIGELIRRIIFVFKGRVIRLFPKGPSRGNVLISYTTLPFLNPRTKTLEAHTNRWECKQMAQIFLDLGYAVDVIDFENTSFKPAKKYRYFIDVGTNIEHIGGQLGSECVKIYHATGSYWSFQNQAEEKRLVDIQKRRVVKLAPRRLVPQTSAAEVADIITLIGNGFTESTYSHLSKPIIRIPISTTHLFEKPAGKDMAKVRHNFIWFGGAGAVHKGLDLVLEAFLDMPDYTLTVFGKLNSEGDFLQAFNKELFHTPNIHMKGWINPGSPEFAEIVAHSLAIIYPSCSEGTAGSVVLAMHAGLIPIVSRESGVDVGNFGVMLKENTIGEIQAAVRELSTESSSVLAQRASSAWEYARATHTRQHFDTVYRATIADLDSGKLLKPQI